VVVGLLTAPGESASSTRAVTIRAELEAWLPQLAERYTEETGGVGVLCLRLDGCDPVTPEPPPPPPPAEGCSCRGGGAAGPSGGLFGLGLVAAALRRRRSGRSFDRFRRRV
jgi:MYXO-CTERM domain-containing protein